MNPGPNGSCGVMLFAQEPRGNDYVRLHGPKGDLYLFRHSGSDSLGACHGIFVTHHNTGPNLQTKLQQAVIRESAQYEADAAPSQSLGDVLEPLQHELIMAAIGMMSVRDETEERDHRPF